MGDDRGLSLAFLYKSACTSLWQATSAVKSMKSNPRGLQWCS